MPRLQRDATGGDFGVLPDRRPLEEPNLESEDLWPFIMIESLMLQTANLRRLLEPKVRSENLNTYRRDPDTGNI